MFTTGVSKYSYMNEPTLTALFKKFLSLIWMLYMTLSIRSNKNTFSLIQWYFIVMICTISSFYLWTFYSLSPLHWVFCLRFDFISFLFLLFIFSLLIDFCSLNSLLYINDFQHIHHFSWYLMSYFKLIFRQFYVETSSQFPLCKSKDLFKYLSYI